MSYRSEPRATFRWKKCRDSETKFDRLDKSTRKEKVAQGPTRVSKLLIDREGNPLYHINADPLRDIGKTRHKIASSLV